MPDVSITGLQCGRCSHMWVPRTERRPEICPKCKTPYWDREPAARNNPGHGNPAGKGNCPEGERRPQPGRSL